MTVSTTSRPIKPEALAFDFAGRVIEAERTCLATAWRDPIGLNDAAFEAGLCGRHFVRPEHSFQFYYLCTCADQGRAPSIGECLTLATTLDDVTLDDWRLDDVLWVHYDPPMLSSYVETVRRNSEIRERAQHHLVAAAQLGSV